MGRIPDELIERIAEANDIVAVITGYIPLKRAGSTYRALCPFHNEKSPSFHVSPARQSFHCFGCGKGGSVFRFVMEYESLDFIAAVKRLGERVGIPVVEEAVSAEEDARLRMRKRLLALHKEAADWFHMNLMRTPAGAVARSYLASRGFDREVAARWGIGYAPDAWDVFGAFALGRDYTEEELVLGGLVKARDEGGHYDTFRDRLMFPIRNDIGEVIAFSGRVLGSSDAAKYVNSPESPIFTKGNVLFGLHASKRDLISSQTAIVCEGQIDLIRCFEAGVKNVVAPQGTAFTERQAAMLKRFVSEVVLCFDADNAGEKAADRSCAELLNQGLIVRVAVMPPGEDPDSLIRKSGPDAFRAVIDGSLDFFENKVRQLGPEADVKARRAFATNTAGFIALLKDAVQREDAIGKVVSRLGLARPDFERMIPRDGARRRVVEDEASEPVETVLEQPSHAVRMLCLYLLADPGTRALVQAQPWKMLIEGLAGAEILERLISAPGDPAAPSYLSSLPGAEEAVIAGLLQDRIPPEADVKGPAYWRQFARTQVDRKLRRIDAEIIAATASGSDISSLQNERKELLDLKNLFTDVPRPSTQSEDPF